RHLFQVALFKAVVLLRSFAENNQLHKQDIIEFFNY
ncbi:hypothetical protein NPIL_680881, partial [Nephila pilipes]